MRPVAAVLRYCARHGRIALVLGLTGGLLLPGAAHALRPWLPHMIVLLLFLTTFRIGRDQARRGLAHGSQALGAVLVFQLVLPLAALALFSAFGVAATPYALAVLLMLSAPSITGSPNLTILLGHDPEPAFRLVLIGTAVLPVTIIPVFWLLPGLGDLTTSLVAALKLLATIGVTVALAFFIRARTLPEITGDQTEAIDGVVVVLLAVVVIGLMSALGPALLDTPLTALKWLLVATGANLGMQLATFFVLKRRSPSAEAVPYAVVAGNRNFALFLVALPDASIDPLLVFLGCYQVPMYLTPLLMRRVYRN